MILGFVLGLLSHVELIKLFAHLYLIAQIVPHLPLTIRRRRDAGKHWAWLFIGLIPLIASILLIVLFGAAFAGGLISPRQSLTWAAGIAHLCCG